MPVAIQLRDITTMPKAADRLLLSQGSLHPRPPAIGQDHDIRIQQDDDLRVAKFLMPAGRVNFHGMRLRPFIPAQDKGPHVRRKPLQGRQAQPEQIRCVVLDDEGDSGHFRFLFK